MFQSLLCQSSNKTTIALIQNAIGLSYRMTQYGYTIVNSTRVDTEEILVLYQDWIFIHDVILTARDPPLHLKMLSAFGALSSSDDSYLMFTGAVILVIIKNR